MKIVVNENAYKPSSANQLIKDCVVDNFNDADKILALFLNQGVITTLVERNR